MAAPKLLPRLSVIRLFDPWKSPLCTCPLKLTLNPYTGCGHGCLYCYARSYIPNFSSPKPKKNLVRRLVKDLSRVPSNMLLELSASSDPYTPPEARLGLTRRVLELISRFRGCDLRLLIVTKSDLVVRDIDLLKDLRAAVAITITTLSSELASIIEPNAPDPERRLRAVKELSRAKVPVIVRIDPIIPFINDSYSELRDLVRAVSELGAVQVISSTYKARADSLRRLVKALPKVGSKLRDAYVLFGEKKHGSIYLSIDARIKYMMLMKNLCEELGLAFTTCREGLSYLNTPGIYCDGSSFTYRK